jgi:transcription initiation factor TFIID subunit 13
VVVVVMMMMTKKKNPLEPDSVVETQPMVELANKEEPFNYPLPEESKDSRKEEKQEPGRREVEEGRGKQEEEADKRRGAVAVGEDEEIAYDSAEEQPQEEDLKIRFVPTDINYKRRKRLFTRDLRPMMYGFGDAPQTLPSTVDLMEEMVLEYIMGITQRAGDLGRKRGRFRTEDLIFLVRKDPKRYARIEELLYMNEELKRARRAFEIEDYEKLGEDKMKYGGKNTTTKDSMTNREDRDESEDEDEEGEDHDGDGELDEGKS